LSFGWRQDRWKEAGTLIRARPILGWGLGTYPVEQSRLLPNSWPRNLLRTAGPSLRSKRAVQVPQLVVWLKLPQNNPGAQSPPKHGAPSCNVPWKTLLQLGSE
jgi:hypothetical protein